MSTIKSTNLSNKLKQRKSLLQNSISNIKRKIKPYSSTADNYKKRRNKWTKEDNKSKIVLTKYLNFITLLNSHKLKGSIEKISMS